MRRQAREAFVRNHPIKAPSDYEENLANKSLVEAMNAKLQEVDALIHSAGTPYHRLSVAFMGGPLIFRTCVAVRPCTESVSPEGLSYDDIDFYGKFRGAWRGLVLVMFDPTAM